MGWLCVKFHDNRCKGKQATETFYAYLTSNTQTDRHGDSSVLPNLKLTEIIVLLVYHTISFGFTLFRHFRAIISCFWNHFVWLRITDEGSLPEIRIWSILFIKSDLKLCIHQSRCLFSYSMWGGGIIITTYMGKHSNAYSNNILWHSVMFWLCFYF